MCTAKATRHLAQTSSSYSQFSVSTASSFFVTSAGRADVIKKPRLTSTLWCSISLALHSSSSSAAFSTMSKPSLPLRHAISDSIGSNNDGNAIDLTDLAAKLTLASAHREAAYETSRSIKTALIQVRDQIGTPQAAAALKELLVTYSSSIMSHGGDEQTTFNNRTPRQANLSERVEEMVQLAAYQHFLETGTLLPPVPWATDDEYLGGAVMGLAQDLQHYGLGRATVRDVASVQAAGNLVSASLDYLLSLDFRNGPLRRKYDGTKYSLKALETLLYELAVTSKEDASGGAEPESKRSKNQESLLPSAELQALKERMDHRDELRETIIKKCRDGQKAAKQSIFCLHRGDRTKAVALLQQCATSIQQDLLPIVKEEPPLRSGSFGNVVEEYVEAKLFAVWLHGRNVANEAMDQQNNNDGPRSGVLLTPHDFDNDILPLEPDEYIGGLCDLTGEIGRYAVQCGTSRNVQGVKACLAANSNILTALELVDRLPPKSSKKMGAVRSSVRKLERMLYELSLSQAAGGRHVMSNVADIKEEDQND